MNCPHCRVAFHDNPRDIILGKDADGGWKLRQQICPNCKKYILHLINGQPISHEGFLPTTLNRGPYANRTEEVVDTNCVQVWPKSTARQPCPPEIPKEIAEDYTEACLVLADSPKSSAAMSRRCLQNILRDPNAANAQQKELADQIDHALKAMPSYIAKDIDAVRNIGNFAAHPMKSKTTGSILPVEPGEAEWNLDVIEELFDFYYVQPTKSQSKRDALNTKLQSVGKPLMK
jgi:Domain of unknown function (DUF4145)